MPRPGPRQSNSASEVGKSSGSGRMVRRRRSPIWHLAPTGVLVLAALAALSHDLWRVRPYEPPAQLLPAPIRTVGDAAEWAQVLPSLAAQVLAELGIGADQIAWDRPQAQGAEYIEVRVPSDLPLATVNLALNRLIEGLGGRVLQAVEKMDAQQVEIRCGHSGGETTRFLLRRDPELRRRTGRIALILDDFGSWSWRQGLAERFCALPQPLTLAVLPNEGHVQEMIDLALAQGHELLVHLPMEPDGFPRADPGEQAIFVDQETEAIHRLVVDAIDKVPGAVGLNNHMGSRATADPRVMEVVLRLAKQRGLLFLDSRTTARSVAFGLARQLRVPAAQRDLFIDPVDEVEAVSRKLWELAELAAEQGQAIGIGHDREHTLLALETVLPRLESRGFRFVPISRLTQ